MHTWRLVDAGVFFTFCLTPFYSAAFFFFWGPCKFFFAELPHCVNHSVCTVFFFGPCAGFAFKSFLGASVTLHS